MKLPLECLTIDSPRVADKLITYLLNISRYPNFDKNMELNVFVNSAGDFTAMEAVNYRIGFTSNEHKLIETISSKYEPIRTNYSRFYEKVQSMAV